MFPELDAKITRGILIFLLFSVVAVFATRECRSRSQQALLHSLIWNSCAYTWNPEAVKHHRQECALLVNAFRWESRLWSGAGWSFIAADVLILIWCIDLLARRRS